jgi:hypothetical protein
MDRIYTFDDLENIQRFVRSLKRKAKKLKITLQLTNDKFLILSNNITCSGFFQNKYNNNPGILATATNRSINIWLPTLVHESCHMDQWSEKSNVWKRYIDENIGIIDEWLDGKNISQRKVFKALDICRELELDCEQRAVQKIIKYNLPIDIKEYIQKANCYIFFYNYLKISRKWSLPENSPYNNPNIYKKVSSEWYEDYGEMPNNVLKLFKKYNIGYEKIKK